MKKIFILILILCVSCDSDDSVLYSENVNGCNDSFALNYAQNSENDLCEYADYIVEAGSYYYSPQNLVIELGESVQWNNLSGYHDVVTISGPTNIDLSPVSAPRLIGSFTFTVPGTYEYICSIGSHSSQGMVGTITVNN